jgi:hypothetical protein
MATTISNLPGAVNFKVYQNDTLTKTLTITDDADDPIDLSAATIKMEVRSSVGGTVQFTFESGDGITVGGTDDNVITISKLVDITAGSYLYDLEIIYSGGEVQTLIKGSFTVTADITR